MKVTIVAILGDDLNLEVPRKMLIFESVCLREANAQAGTTEINHKSHQRFCVCQAMLTRFLQRNC